MQNVNIDQEVENAMMASPQQPRGIVDLLASELKARDAKARNQLSAMMAPAPDPNTIISQNEKETENNVRQEIGQKMQARVMQERQAQARQRQALAGIAGQRAPNMRMADGGIVGYAEGGPTPGAVSPKAADPQDIKRLADLYRQMQASMNAATDPTAKADVQQRLNDLKTQMGDQLPFVMQYLDSTKGIIEPRTKMAEGGIIGFKEGDYVGGITGPMGIFAPGINKVIGFADFLARKGVESLAGLSADVVNRLRQEYEAMQAREMNRPRGDSVAESQMETLGGVLRGAGNVLREGITATLPSPASPPSAGEREATEAQREGRRRGPGAMLEGIASLAPEPQGRNRTELADMGGAPGAGGAPQARREPSAAALADAQAEMDILNAAQRRQDEAEQATREPQPYVLSDLAKGAGVEGFFSGIPSLEEMYPPAPEDASLSYKIGSGIKALTTPFQVLGGFLQPKDDGQLTFSDLGPIGREIKAGFTGAEMPNQQDDAEVAQEIVATAPPAEPAYDPTKNVEQIANPSLRRAIAGTQAAPAPATGIAAPAAEQDGEAAATQLATTVASNPTPQNMSRFESEIGRLMERRESPVRALSNFLTSFSQARGGSMGGNLAIATTAMRAADDALDKQIVALEQLRRADQISERDFGLKTQQVNDERAYRKAMGAYYENIPVVQKQIEELRQAGRDREATRKVRETAVSFLLPYRTMHATQAKDELGRGATEAQIQDRANKIFEEQLQMLIKVVEGPQNSASSVVQDAFAVIGQ